MGDLRFQFEGQGLADFFPVLEGELQVAEGKTAGRKRGLACRHGEDRDFLEAPEGFADSSGPGHVNLFPGDDARASPEARFDEDGLDAALADIEPEDVLCHQPSLQATTESFFSLSRFTIPRMVRFIAPRCPVEMIWKESLFVESIPESRVMLSIP